MKEFMYDFLLKTNRLVNALIAVHMGTVTRHSVKREILRRIFEFIQESGLIRANFQAADQRS